MTEEEIRPKNLFNELLRLNREDISRYFLNCSYRKIECPACGERGEFSFEKDGFHLERCGSCGTIYVSPRPEKEAFDAYYTTSKSAEFWATTFYKQTLENRREKLWKPKATMIKEKISLFSEDTDMVVDIGGGYGVFMEEFTKISSYKHHVIEPSPHLAQVCREKGLNVIQAFLEDIKPDILEEGKKAFVSFELFEHLHEPGLFLNTLYSLMQKGDLFIFTTLSGMGIDIQGLWEDSKAISPPMHLNFFNPKSVVHLLGRSGFKVLEVTTPGKLDIDILENNKELIKDRFWRHFIEQASPEEKVSMQDFVASNGLSSHMMIVCSK